MLCRSLKNGAVAEEDSRTYVIILYYSYIAQTHSSFLIIDSSVLLTTQVLIVDFYRN